MVNTREHFKQTATSLLKTTGLYERLRASSAYDLYWKLADSEIIARRDREVEFYRRTLQGMRPGDLIFDIGANQGYKTDVFLRLGARVIAVDPDPANSRRLTERFLRWRLNPKAVQVVEKAVSDSPGHTTMWIDAPGSAKNTLSSKWVSALRVDRERFGDTLEFAQTTRVETTTLDDLVRAYGTPFFIKIDVEGHELSVLEGIRRPVPYLSFEVNLPEFRAEGLECIERLKRLQEGGEFNYASDSQPNLVFDRWLRYPAFGRELSGTTEHSIEIFWRSAH